MKVLVVGNGGREHAIINSIKKNEKVKTIYALSGNGGMYKDAILVDINVMDKEKILDFALCEKIDYVIVSPDDPLADGLVDLLEENGLRCFGPRKNAAIIESSKAFSKDLMKKYGIPTAKFEVFTESKDAIRYLDETSFPVVIKADGLALGKGVIIAQTKDEAREAIVDMMENAKFGKSGEKIVIEEFLTGVEVSVLSFTDGKTVVPMISSMDHKRSGDGDTGLNTGGMGAIAPNPYYNDEIASQCMEKIFIPTVEAMNMEGRKFKGCLYFGLMICGDEVKVIEYNCRFGDPETQVVLPLLETDLLTVMEAVTDEKLAEIDVKFSAQSACTVVLASKGYPLSYDKGFEVDVAEDVLTDIYFAGVERRNDKFFTNGGRVLAVTALADDLASAIKSAYKKAEKVECENLFSRMDIGRKALEILKEKR